MHLVLMKGSVSFCRVNRHDGVWSRDFDSDLICIIPEAVKTRNRKDYAVQNFITELFRKRTSEMKVHLRAERIPDRYSLQLKNVAKFDVLENLRFRFGDKVGISVRIALTEYRVSTTEDMAIKECNSCSSRPIELLLDVSGCQEFNCECGMENSKCGVDNTNCWKENIMTCFTALVKITANLRVPQDEISAPIDPPGKTILNQGLCSDLTIIAKDNVLIRGHKTFLSAASPVFRMQFGVNWDKGGLVTTLDMSDVSVKGLNAFLRYVYYHDRLKDAKQEPELAFELLTVAHKYDVASLEAKTLLLLIDMKDELFPTELAFTIYIFVRNIENFAELKWKTARVLMSNAENLEKLAYYQSDLEGNPTWCEEIREEIASAAKKELNT